MYEAKIGNIPLAHTNGVHVFQLVRNARAFCRYQDFVDKESRSPTDCCHRVIAEESLCQQLKSCMGHIMIALIPTMWPFL